MNSSETQETMQEQELEATGDDVARLVPFLINECHL